MLNRTHLMVFAPLTLFSIAVLFVYNYGSFLTKPSGVPIKIAIDRVKGHHVKHDDRTILCKINSSDITNNSRIGDFCYMNSDIFLKLQRSRVSTHSNKSSTCITGHVANFSPVCGADGCLRVINTPVNGGYNLQNDTVASVLRSDLSKKWIMLHLHLIGGWCNVDRQMPFTTDISRMQWSHGVYGSVGEIGVYMGKYSSILALNTNTAAGERFFAADIFNKKTKMSTVQGNVNKFLQTMQLWGLSVYSNQSANRLHLWYDSSAFLNKAVFHSWNLPAFRLLSIDGGHVRPIVLKDFEIAACVLREGGIIAFDDALNFHQNGVRFGIQDFFRIHGARAFKPLVFYRSKLFVCTSAYFDLYFQYIRNNLATKYTLIDREDVHFLNNGNRYFYADNYF